MRAFFEKAKKLAPALVAIISLSAASAASTAPPAAEDPAPPSTAGEEFVMPSSATEQNAEVA
jgi:hypothetical protein